MSIFGMLTNQATAPKGHPRQRRVQPFLVRADAPGHVRRSRTRPSDASYVNRSKYTEKFIAQNILNLPEYAGSADTHFDSVRPMNHAYEIPATYTAKATADQGRTPPQTGPDANQTSVWAIK